MVSEKIFFKTVPMAKSTHKKVTNPSSQVGMSYFSQSKQYSFPDTVTFKPSELRHFVKFPAGASFFQQISKPCSSRTGIENTILKSGEFERINDLHKLTFANKRDWLTHYDCLFDDERAQIWIVKRSNFLFMEIAPYFECANQIFSFLDKVFTLF